MTGKRYNAWLVLGRVANDAQNRARWLAQCDCGTVKIVDGYSIRKGTSPSCGCRTRQCRGEANNMYKHGMFGTREWQTWNNMLARCYIESASSYHRYGGRGITVCDAWRQSFDAFYQDMGPKPSGLSIDRIDVNGNYEPGNCRWADATTQANNRRPAQRRVSNVDDNAHGEPDAAG